MGKEKLLLPAWHVLRLFLKVFNTSQTSCRCIAHLHYFQIYWKGGNLFYHHILIYVITAQQSDHVILPEIKYAIHSCDQNYRKLLPLNVQFLVFQSFLVKLLTTKLVPSHKMDRTHKELQEKGSFKKKANKKKKKKKFSSNGSDFRVCFCKSALTCTVTS